MFYNADPTLTSPFFLPVRVSALHHLCVKGVFQVGPYRIVWSPRPILRTTSAIWTASVPRASCSSKRCASANTRCVPPMAPVRGFLLFFFPPFEEPHCSVNLYIGKCWKLKVHCLLANNCLNASHANAGRIAEHIIFFGNCMSNRKHLPLLVVDTFPVDSTQLTPPFVNFIPEIQV